MNRMVATVVGLAVVASGAFAAVTARDDGSPMLPGVTGDGAAASYRIVYEVTGDGETTTEERVVARPFDSDIVVRDGDGAVLSERASRAGLLATRSSGSEWVLIDVPFSPASSDTRLDRFGPLVADTRGSDDVGGRPCEVTRTEYDDEAVAFVDRCADAAGIVLREVWLDAAEQVLQTMTAVELDVGSVVVGRTPEGTRLPDADGNGAVRAVESDEPIPFADAFSLRPGDGWEFVGRHLVVPPVLGSPSTAPEAGGDTALVSDVWRRGPDLLVLDQGATKRDDPPFGDGTEIGSFAIDEVGTGHLVVDDRLAAVNVRLDDGGFVRLSGTVRPETLRTLAQEISHLGGDR